MSSLLRGSLLVIAFAAIAPQPAQAQLFRHLFSDCCTKCQQPMCSCTCTRIEPIVETCYKQEKCVNWRTVQCQGTRTETFCETVPVQKAHNVTVDEGCWKMVWCPKPVTKTVCTTEYQQRLACRNVPYTYCKQVPEVTTRVVPQQTVRYVEHKTFTCTRPLTGRMPVCPQPETCAPQCAPQAPCVQPQTTFAPPACDAPAPNCTVPFSAASAPTQTYAMQPVPQAAPAAGLVPQPQHMDTPTPAAVDQWTLVQPRSSTTNAATSPNAYQAQPAATAQAAPTAATVWQMRPMVKPF